MRPRLAVALGVLFGAKLLAGAAELRYEQVGYVYPTWRVPFTYLINQQRTPLGVSDPWETYRLAFEAWNSIPNLPLRFEDGGTTELGKANDRRNVVLVATEWRANAIALNTLYLDGADFLIGNDIEINPNARFSTSGEAGAYDLLAVMTHEVGHCLSLDDLYAEVDRGRTMFGIIRSGETGARQLHPADVADAWRLYPLGPPEPPCVTSVEYKEGAVAVLWNRSPSSNAERTILRRSIDGSEFVEIQRLTRFNTELRDNLLWDANVEPGRTYRYRWSCQDGTGQEGPASEEVVLTPGKRPEVLLAGWWDTDVSSAHGGVARLVAWVDALPGEGTRCWVFYQGQPTGLELHDNGLDGDDLAGDGLYSLRLELPPGLPAGQLLIELVAETAAGLRGLPWPYRHVQSVYGGGRWGDGVVPQQSWLAAAQRFTTRGTEDPALAIWAGGYLGQPFLTERDSRFTAYLFQPNIGAEMELYYAGMPTGIRLFDTGFYEDFGTRDGIYASPLAFARRYLLPPGEYLLEARASKEGRLGPLYPYLTISP